MKKKQKYNKTNNFIYITRGNAIKISDKKIRAFSKELIGKRVTEVLLFLSVQKIAVSSILFKLINSAIPNISKKQVNIKNLFVKNINIDKSKLYRRILTRSQGRVNYIKKRTSRITIHFTIV